ncbi:universal stress protein [Streptomyces pathocidini]|uniref:universal stress protein n=1 Tax=Streptomyces pathocidini TaxID=1650571 RepID=UPI0033DA0370
MPAHIAAGVDGSLESLAAADWAAREALLRGAPLRLVHAWQWPARVGGVRPTDDTQQEWAERLLEEAREHLTGLHPDLTVTADLLPDTPAPALLGAAGRAELLALGSRGLGGLTGFLLGSTALEVLAGAERPVVLVRPGEQGEEPSRTAAAHREVVLGLDPREACDEVIEFAFAAADRRRVPLRAVHSWNAPWTAPPRHPVLASHTYAGGQPSPAVDPRHEEDARLALADALKPWREKFPAVEVTEDAVRGRAGHHLVEAADAAGLLVIGRRVRDADRPPGRRSAHLGAVAHAVIHHARCPVAVVPHTAERAEGSR